MDSNLQMSRMYRLFEPFGIAASEALRSDLDAFRTYGKSAARRASSPALRGVSLSFENLTCCRRTANDEQVR